MYKDTITLFNRYPSKINGDTWYPTVLQGVDLNMDRASLIQTMGVDTSDTVSLHVKYTKSDNNIIVGGKQYVLPKEFAKVPVEDAAQYLTFKSGKEFDFFYVGEWADTTPISDNDYPKGFYNYMNSEYDNVFSITTASGAYDLIQHFEILGK